MPSSAAHRGLLTAAIAASALAVLAPAPAHASEACDVAHVLHTGWSAIDDGMRAPGAAQGLPDARDTALTSLAAAMQPHVEAFGEAVGKVHNQRLWDHGTRIEAHQTAIETALGKDDVDAALAAVGQMRAELEDFLAGECPALPAGAQPDPKKTGEVPTERTLQAVQIARALYDGDVDALDPWLGHYPLPIIFEHSLGEPDDGDDTHRQSTSLADRKRVAAWLDRMAPLFQCGPSPGPRAAADDDCEWVSGLVIAPITSCTTDATCCRFSHEPDGQLMLSHNAVFIDEICFDVDATSGEAMIKHIKLLDGD